MEPMPLPALEAVDAAVRATRPGVCRVCGRAFRAYRPWQAHCSAACRRAWHRRGTDRGARAQALLMRLGLARDVSAIAAVLMETRDEVTRWLAEDALGPPLVVADPHPAPDRRSL